MPFRRSQPRPDLERAARVLGGGAASAPGVLARSADGRWPELLGDAEEKAAILEEVQPTGGWVPSRPAGSGTDPSCPRGSASDETSLGPSSRDSAAQRGADHVRSAVRRLTDEGPDDEVARLDADLRRARRPGVVTLPDELLAGRRGLSSAAVVSLLALVVAVGCAFVLRVLWAERSASASQPSTSGTRVVQVVGGRPATASVPASGGVSPTTAAPGVAGTSASGGSASGVVVAHVVGQVNRPGLVQLRQGARVADAITAAGGTRPGADVSVLNLARLVQDGEQIRVPKPGEVPVTAGGPVPSGAGGGVAGGASGAGAPVSLNSADAAALDARPGVGPVLAQRIVDWRTQHGRFTSVDELGEVSGIGDKLMAQLRPKVTL